MANINDYLSYAVTNYMTDLNAKIQRIGSRIYKMQGSTVTYTFRINVDTGSSYWHIDGVLDKDLQKLRISIDGGFGNFYTFMFDAKGDSQADIAAEVIHKLADMVDSSKNTKTASSMDRLRGHQLLPASIAKRIPPIGSQDNVKDPKVFVKFFSASGVWFVLEFDGRDEMFGWADLGMGGGDLGYFSLSELDRVRNRMGMPAVERDIYFKPKPLSQAKSER